MLIGDSDGKRYIHAPRGVHAQHNGTGWQYPIADGLGSVRGYVAPDSTLLSSVNYTELGVPDTAWEGWAFTGEMRSENGTQYHRARHLAPSLGIWASLDPFEGLTERPMSLNGYTWVEGDPINNTDPNGMQVAQVCKAYAQGSPFPIDDAACVLVDLIVNRERHAQSVSQFFGSLGNIFTQPVSTITLGTLNGIQFYAIDKNGNIYLPNRELYSSEASILQDQFVATGQCNRYPPGHPLSCAGGAGAIATPVPSAGDAGNFAGAAGILNRGVCEIAPLLMSVSQSPATAISTAIADEDDEDKKGCQIEVRSYTVDRQPFRQFGFQHTYIIFTNEHGVKYLFRGGPEWPNGMSRCSNAISPRGALNIYGGLFDATTLDQNIDYQSVTVMRGSNTCEKLGCLIAQSNRIHNDCNAYSAFGPNSNSVTSSLLGSCLIPRRKPNALLAPGWHISNL